MKLLYPKSLLSLTAVFLVLMAFFGCAEDFETSGIKSEDTQLFEQVSSAESGIQFNNELIENSTYN